MSQLEATSIFSTQEELIRSALPFIAQQGWVREALTQGAISAGFDEDAVWRLFPGDISDALMIYQKMADQAMLQYLKALNLSGTTEKIIQAVLCRLQFLNQHKDVAYHMMIFHQKPKHVLLGLQALYRTVHMIWSYAGDISLDYNFYTKRGLLLAVYSATFRYWVKHPSKDLDETERFLRKRIKNVLLIGKIKGSIHKKFQKSLALGAALGRAIVR